MEKNITNEFHLNYLIRGMENRMRFDGSSSRGPDALYLKAAVMLGVVSDIAKQTDCRPLLIGGQANTYPNFSKKSDFDIQFQPLESGTTSNTILLKMREWLNCLASSSLSEVSDEYGRKYCVSQALPSTARNGGGIGDIALVYPLDQGQYKMGSIRLVSTLTKFPWHDDRGIFENPANKYPIVEIGWPYFDNVSGKWITSDRYDFRQRHRIELSGNKIVVSEAKKMSQAEFTNLPPSIQLNIIIRNFGDVDYSFLNLREKAMNYPVSSEYDFTYHFLMSFEKKERKLGWRYFEMVTDKWFVENVIKNVFPFAYLVISSLGGVDQFVHYAREMILSHPEESNTISLLKLASERSILEHDNSATRLVRAQDIAGYINDAFYSYKANKSAFDKIKELDL